MRDSAALGGRGGDASRVHRRQRARGLRASHDGLVHDIIRECGSARSF